MISRLTKILFLVAAACIGTAFEWQRYSQTDVERSRSSTVYNLEIEDGKWHLSGSNVQYPLPVYVLHGVGRIAFLLAVPLLVSDIAHRKRRATSENVREALK